MEPVKFDDCNFTFTAPKGQEERVRDLPTYSLGGQIVSKWILSPEELAKVQETGCLYLMIMGNSMPPVLPMVASPFAGLEDYFQEGIYQGKTLREVIKLNYLYVFEQGICLNREAQMFLHNHLQETAN